MNGSPVRGTNGPVRRTNPPVTGTEALLIVENASNCSGTPYGFNCKLSRGAPKKWPNYRTPARVKYLCSCFSLNACTGRLHLA